MSADAAIKESVPSKEAGPTKEPSKDFVFAPRKVVVIVFFFLCMILKDCDFLCWFICCKLTFFCVGLIVLFL